jgi:hypothetical protein
LTYSDVQTGVPAADAGSAARIGFDTRNLALGEATGVGAYPGACLLDSGTPSRYKSLSL